jgi:hypothetical protein
MECENKSVSFMDSFDRMQTFYLKESNALLYPYAKDMTASRRATQNASADCMLSASELADTVQKP